MKKYLIQIPAQAHVLAHYEKPSAGTYALCEKIRLTATEIPDFNHGDKLLTCDDYECTFLAPSADQTKAVVEFGGKRTAPAIGTCAWCDLMTEEQAAMPLEEIEAMEGGDQ